MLFGVSNPCKIIKNIVEMPTSALSIMWSAIQKRDCFRFATVIKSFTLMMPSPSCTKF